MMNQMTKDERMIPQEAEQDAGEISAQELGAQMVEGAQQAQEESAPQEDAREAMMNAVREGIAELFEDGWTAQELTAFSQDPSVRARIAQGHSVARAACAYLRDKLAGRRHGVPTTRTIAAGAPAEHNPVEHMTDEQFDAFSRRAQAAMMAGKKVRI